MEVKNLHQEYGVDIYAMSQKMNRNQDIKTVKKRIHRSERGEEENDENWKAVG